MSGYYKIQIRLWPYSTGNGNVTDIAACGGSDHHFRVRADSFDDACKAAKHIASGAKTNPRVWQANIHTIAYDGESP